MSFRLPSLVILALIEAEIAGRGRICPPPFPGRDDSQTLSSARVNMDGWSFTLRSNFPTVMTRLFADRAKAAK